MGSWQLHLNQLATRRKAFHYAISPKGEVEYATRNADEVFNWLADMGITEFRLRCEDRMHTVKFTQRSPPAEK